MAKKKLNVTLLSYPLALLEKWKKVDHSFLTSSQAPKYIKDILVSKAKKRPSRRFFGEAFIASTMDTDTIDGWYGSYKWLTSDKWLTGKNLKPRFEKPFYEALISKIGANAISDLQRHARACFDMYKGELNNSKPVAPDLWLVDKSGKNIFIESKMEGDRIRPHQLAGLALIKKYLKSSVSLVCLYRAGKRPPPSKTIQRYIDRFSAVYEKV
jgi:hypothetical protein